MIDYPSIVGIAVDEAEDDPQVSRNRDSRKTLTITSQATDPIAGRSELLRGGAAVDEMQEAGDPWDLLRRQPTRVTLGIPVDGAVSIGTATHKAMLPSGVTQGLRAPGPGTRAQPAQ